MKCEVTAEHVAGNIVNNKNAEEKSDEQSLKDEEKAKQEKGIKISPQISLMCHEDFAVFFFSGGGGGGGHQTQPFLIDFLKTREGGREELQFLRAICILDVHGNTHLLIVFLIDC